MKPYLYDMIMSLMNQTSLFNQRKNIIAKAKNNTLEIGSGTGINFPLYKKATTVHAIELDPSMLKRSITRKNKASIPITLHEANAENLPFPNDTFDTVVSTLVFCTIKRPAKALEEIKRVVKKDGLILFFEHVQMKQPFLAKIQNLLTPIWQRMADGCHLNRNTLQLIEREGFQIKQVNSSYKGLFLTIICTIK